MGRLCAAAIRTVAVMSLTSLALLPPVDARRAARPAEAAAPAVSPAVRAINAERSARGLRPLREDGRLGASAASWAGMVAARGRMSHDGAAARMAAVYPGRGWGEVVAAGYPDAASVVEGWMASPGHRRQILGDFAIVGVGRSRSRDGMPYDCAQFVR